MDILAEGYQMGIEYKLTSRRSMGESQYKFIQIDVK